MWGRQERAAEPEVKIPEIVDIQGSAAMTAYKARKDQVMQAMQDIHEWIFRVLSDEGAGAIQGKIKGIGEDIMPTADLVVEVANSIAAAASIEHKDYTNLVELVKGITSLVDTNELWSTAGFKVAEACLKRHPAQTRYFLLKLLQGGVIDIRLIHMYLDVLPRSARLTLTNVLLGVYFGPELIAHNSTFLNELIGNDLLWKENDSVLRVIFPGASCVQEIKWDGFVEKRDLGVSDNELLAAVRADDFEKIQGLVTVGNFAESVIPFSLHEGYFHYEYRQVGTYGYNNVSLLDAVGLFEARECFTGITQNLPDNKAYIGSCAQSLVVGGFLPELRDFGIDEAAINACLPECIHFHKNDLVDHLLESHSAITGLSVLLAMLHANFPAVIAMDTATDAHIPRGMLDHNMSVYDCAAIGNAVQAFMYLLSTHEGEFDACAWGVDGRNFLNYAGVFGGWDVFRVWMDGWGCKGCNLLDCNGLNGHHYAVVCGIHPYIGENKKLSERMPHYTHICEQTLADRAK